MICGFSNKAKDEGGRTGLIVRVFLGEFTGFEGSEQIVR
jgi:hypothetical protein